HEFGHHRHHDQSKNPAHHITGSKLAPRRAVLKSDLDAIQQFLCILCDLCVKNPQWIPLDRAACWSCSVCCSRSFLPVSTTRSSARSCRSRCLSLAVRTCTRGHLQPTCSPRPYRCRSGDRVPIVGDAAAPISSVLSRSSSGA